MWMEVSHIILVILEKKNPNHICLVIEILLRDQYASNYFINDIL